MSAFSSLEYAAMGNIITDLSDPFGYEPKDVEPAVVKAAGGRVVVEIFKETNSPHFNAFELLNRGLDGDVMAAELLRHQVDITALVREAAQTLFERGDLNVPLKDQIIRITAEVTKVDSPLFNAAKEVLMNPKFNPLLPKPEPSPEGKIVLA